MHLWTFVLNIIAKHIIICLAVWNWQRCQLSIYYLLPPLNTYISMLLLFINLFNIKIVFVTNYGAGEQMWAREFVGTKSTFSPHSINIIPTFYQQCTHPHKFPINYQLFSNVFPRNSPLLNNFSTFLPLQNQHSPHSPIFCQCSSSLWGDCGENVDIYLFLILLLNDSSIVGRMWGTCWGKNLGKMLIHIFSKVSQVGQKSEVMQPLSWQAKKITTGLTCRNLDYAFLERDNRAIF